MLEIAIENAGRKRRPERESLIHRRQSECLDLSAGQMMLVYGVHVVRR